MLLLSTSRLIMPESLLHDTAMIFVYNAIHDMNRTMMQLLVVCFDCRGIFSLGDVSIVGVGMDVCFY